MVVRIDYRERSIASGKTGRTATIQLLKPLLWVLNFEGDGTIGTRRLRTLVEAQQAARGWVDFGRRPVLSREDS